MTRCRFADKKTTVVACALLDAVAYAIFSTRPGEIMHVRALISSSALMLTWTLVATSAHAEEGYQAPTTIKEKRVFVGVSAGMAYAIVEHPLIKSDGFGAAALGIHVGFNVSERWTVGLELSTFEHGMTRESGGAPFVPTNFLTPQAGCNNCEPPAVGGWISDTTAMFGTMGPRVEFSPLGRDGLYLGASTGVGMLIGIDTQYGFGGGARAGYRLRVGNVVGLAIEGGLQGQYFRTGSTVFPYAALMLRPYF